MIKEYAVYKNDNLLVMGTAEECMEFLGIKKTTWWYYKSPAYVKRVENRPNRGGCIRVYKLDEE